MFLTPPPQNCASGAYFWPKRQGLVPYLLSKNLERTLNCHKLVPNIKIRIHVSCDECAYTRKIIITIKWIECLLISVILNLNLWGQQLLPILWASKIKMAFCSQNKNVSHWMDKIIYEAVFTKEKKGSGVLCTAHIARLMDACLVSCSRGCQQPCQFVFYFWTN